MLPTVIYKKMSLISNTALKVPSVHTVPLKGYTFLRQLMKPRLPMKGVQKEIIRNNKELD
jgi:hypothetical protein